MGGSIGASAARRGGTSPPAKTRHWTGSAGLSSNKKMPAAVWARPASPESGKGSVAGGSQDTRRRPPVSPPPRPNPFGGEGQRWLTLRMYDSRGEGANGKTATKRLSDEATKGWETGGFLP